MIRLRTQGTCTSTTCTPLPQLRVSATLITLMHISPNHTYIMEKDPCYVIIDTAGKETSGLKIRKGIQGLHKE